MKSKFKFHSPFLLIGVFLLGILVGISSILFTIRKSQPQITSPTPSTQSPLATWDPSQADAFNDSTVGTGTLDISARCVLLTLVNQKTVLLVWPEPTSWNPTSKAIDFIGVDDERMELHDGDQITPGGSTASSQSRYVSPPNPSCQADEVFIVASLTPIQN